MAAFEKNIETALTRTGDRAPKTLEEGKQVNYLDVFNQAHRIGTWEYVIGKQQVFWSPEVYEIHGLKPGVGPVDVKQAIRFYHPEDAKRIAEILTKAIQLKSGFRSKLRILQDDGTVRMTESIGAPMLDKAGRVTRLLGTFRDITHQTEFENIRRGQQDLLIRIIRCLPVAAALIDRNQRYIAWSNRWLSDFNLAEDGDHLGKNHRDILPDVARFQAKHLEVAMKGVPVGQDNDRIQRDNGVSYITDWRIQPWRDKTGGVGGALMLFHVKYTGAPRHKTDALPANEKSTLSRIMNLLSDSEQIDRSVADGEGTKPG
jgi:PAS domain S-box-containing protein